MRKNACFTLTACVELLFIDYSSYTVKIFIFQGDVVQMNKVYPNVFLKAPGVEQHSYSSQYAPVFHLS